MKRANGHLKLCLTPHPAQIIAIRWQYLIFWWVSLSGNEPKCITRPHSQMDTNLTLSTGIRNLVMVLGTFAEKSCHVLNNLFTSVYKMCNKTGKIP